MLSAISARSQTIGGLIVKNIVNFNGNSVVVDSFDSSDPTKSFWQTNLFYQGINYGIYTNTLRTTDASTINVGNTEIYGYVDTAPSGTATLMSNGSVGDLNWIGSNPNSPLNTGIQFGHLKDDMNVVFADVVLPATTNSYGSGWFQPAFFSSGTNIGGITYYYIITNIVTKPGTQTNKIYYSLSPANSKHSIFINASNVVLYLTNGINMTSGNALTLNTNSSVEIYVGPTNAALTTSFDTGSGTVNNLTQYAPAFKIYGLPSCTNVKFGPNPILTTWLYASEASLTFNGGGNVTYDVVGAIFCNNITINGHYHFHFDETLATVLPSPVWIISQPSNQVVQAGSNAVFTVSVGGSTPVSYRWFFNQINQSNLLFGGTNFSSLTLTSVQAANSGNYFVVATNLFGAATSTPAILFVYTNFAQLAGQLGSPSSSTNGQFQFNIAGVTGLNYAVQTSTNLIDWISLSTNVSPFIFTDTNANLFPQQFYRAVYFP